MPDSDTTSGVAGQAVSLGADVLNELQEAVHAADAPVPEVPVSEVPVVVAAPEPMPQAQEAAPKVPEESPQATQEQIRRIQDIVERAKRDIATILAEVKANHGKADEDERRRKAQELVAKIKGGSPTAT